MPVKELDQEDSRAVNESHDDDSGFDEAFAEFAGEGDEAAEEDDQVEDDSTDHQQAAEKPSKEERQEKTGKSEKVEDKDRRIAELEHQVRSQNGRVASLNQTLTKTRSALTALKTPPQDAAKEEGDKSKWEQLKEEFPELAEAVDNRLASVNDTVRRATDAITQVSESVNPILERELGEALTEQYKALESKHDDWEDIVFGDGKDTYQAWLKDQPAPVQGLVRSQDARDAIFLLDAYKSSPVYRGGNGESSRVRGIKEKRKEQLRNSAGVVSRRVGHTPEAGLEDDFEAAFDFYSRQKEKKRSTYSDII